MSKVALEAFAIGKEQDTFVLSTEISTIGDFERIYPDAADVGVTVIGLRHEITFYVDSAKVENGEMVAWSLRPTPESEKILAGRKVRMEVFND